MARRFPKLTAARTAWLTLVFASLLGSQVGAQIPTASAGEQMAAVYARQTARTEAERKLSSDLLVALDRQRGAAWLEALPALDMDVTPGADGRLTLDLRATVDDRLLARIRGLGGEVVNAHPRFGAARIRLHLERVPALAEDTGVRGIGTALPMLTQMINVSQGDVAHGADTARIDFGVDGTGVTACAMSDSVDALAAVQATGDLPPGVFVLPGQSGNPGTSEGTALLEILHDLAPGADLGFATGSGGEAQMAQNILDLAAAGCDVIVDDILYLGEAVFQDGIVAQAVEQVVADGVAFYSAAGNSGNLSNGTSGVFEGDYTATALPAPLVGAGMSAHDFGGGNAGDAISLDPPVLITLQWADPFGASGNDYDLFLLDPGLTAVLAFSTFVQDGDDLPLEFIDSSGRDDTGNRLVVVKFSGDDRFLHLNTHRGQLDVATDGQIFGHPAAEGAIAVAAVNVATAGGAPFTGGAANPVEVFSSDGPRRIFFDAGGGPVASAPGAGRGPTPVERDKPDVAAADGVSTATPGFDPFFGTSASAPHAAAIDALLQDLVPEMSVVQRYNTFRSTALDIEAPGFDRDSGAGIIMAPEPFNVAIFADGFETGDTSSWSGTTE